MLLYLVKYSRPDIANGVRELSKVMDGATLCHLKNLMRMVKYVTDTPMKCLVMDKSKLGNMEKWSMVAFCDSDYAGDRDKRVSVTGFIIYISNVPVSWRSKAQRGVTLSSSEAEYVAVSEVCAEVLFIKQVLEFLGVQVVLPIEIMVDNIGAIFLANNYTMSQRTRHIDIRYHFVREYIEDGTVIIKFVRSEDNDADIFTKNLGTQLYHKHSSKFMDDMDARVNE
jgi:hypothetical protein